MAEGTRLTDVDRGTKAGFLILQVAGTLTEERGEQAV